MRRLTWMVGMIAGVTVCLGGSEGIAQQSLKVRIDRWIQISQVAGRVTREQRGVSQAARIGDRLQAVGDGVTTGKGSTAMLSVDTNVGTISVSENAKLRVESLEYAPDNGRITRLLITSGQARLQVRRFTHRGSRLDMRTPAGLSGVRGTDFGIAVQPSGKTGLVVRQGQVASAAQRRVVAVNGGFQNFTIPGEPPSQPVPLRNDTRLEYRFQPVIQGGVRGVRLVGRVDPVNSVLVEDRPQNTDRNGQFVTDLQPLPNSLKIRVVVITPLGKNKCMNRRFGKTYWRLLPGGAMALVFALLLKLGAFQPLEQTAYNALFHLRGEQTWDDRLVIVAIDDASITQLGRFPWDRQRYTQLLNVLSKSDPSLVVFNLVWSEASPDDYDLAPAIAHSGRVVLAEAWDSTGFPLKPVPQLQAAAIDTGHILRQQDSDGITRQIELQMHSEPALGLAVIRAYTLVQEMVSQPEPDQFLWLNWVGSARKIRSYSFVDVINGRIPPQSLEDKIVLVGTTAVGFDTLITPFDRNPPASSIHLHATVIHNLLQQNALHPISSRWWLVMLLLGGPGFSVLLSHYREEHQALIWASLCIAWGMVGLLLLNWAYWLPIAFPLCLLTSTAAAVAVGERLRVNALLQRQVHQLWQTYQRDLVEQHSSRVELDQAGLDRQAGQGHNGNLGSIQSAIQLAALADQFGRSQSAQAAIARSLSIGLLAADIDGFIWFCNSMAARWLQIEVRDDLTARLVPEWLSLAQWQQDLQTLQQHLRPAPKELHRGDRWFELKLEPLIYPSVESAAIASSQTLDGLLLVLEDITLRKQAEIALEHQVEELRRVAQLKDDFLSTVSHELRSPMANIKMAIELLKIAPTEEASTRYLKILQTECNREIDLISDLLDLQHLEAGVQIFNPENIDLNTWLPPIIAPFYERVEAHQQTLHLHLSPHLPTVTSDQNGLQRILVELVHNACKYTPPDGKIEIEATWNPTHVKISVSNSGVEIPTTELPRVFEKFYRVPQLDPWKQGGTGLGLALVKKLVEELGGNIQANSGSGQTIFTVQLPRSRADGQK